MERHAVEMTFASIVTNYCHLLNRDSLPVEVRFKHACSGDFREYQRIFKSQVQFGAGENTLLFDRGLLGMRISTSDRRLGFLMQQQARMMEAGILSPAELPVKVAQVILAQIHLRGDLSLAHVAGLLQFSPRQLQRMLGGVRVSYSDILDEVRKSSGVGTV